MAFSQFDIIGALNTYCETNGIVFIWHYNEFEANITASQQYNTDQLILVVDLRPSPIMAEYGNKISEIAYSGLFMLGKKFDATGQPASPEEFAIQKYERRLLDLMQLLVYHAGAFKCEHDLGLTIGAMSYLINAFDSNIDFAVAEALTFTQL